MRKWNPSVVGKISLSLFADMKKVSSKKILDDTLGRTNYFMNVSEKVHFWLKISDEILIHIKSHFKYIFNIILHMLVLKGFTF